MRYILFLLCILLFGNLYGDVTSQKELFSKQYIAVKNNYVQALRTNDGALFAQSAQDFRSLGQAIASANSSLMRWMNNDYFSSDRHRNDTNMKMALTSLGNANNSLLSFAPPPDMSPSNVRKVDAYINLISKSISEYDAACQKVNMAHPESTYQWPKVSI